MTKTIVKNIALRKNVREKARSRNNFIIALLVMPCLFLIPRSALPDPFYGIIRLFGMLIVFAGIDYYSSYIQYKNHKNQLYVQVVLRLILMCAIAIFTYLFANLSYIRYTFDLSYRGYLSFMTKATIFATCLLSLGVPVLIHVIYKFLKLIYNSEITNISLITSPAMAHSNSQYITFDYHFEINGKSYKKHGYLNERRFNQMINNEQPFKVIYSPHDPSNSMIFCYK